MRPSAPGRRLLSRIGVLALLWCVGVYMRAPILIAAPLGRAIHASLGLDRTALGALTTLPVLLLGAGALPAAWLIARIGARNALAGALLLVAVASALRGLAANTLELLAATAAMGLGIAIMQPALPGLIPRLCPGFVALASAVYLNGMMMGEFIGGGLTLPLLMPWVGHDWHLALRVFSLPALVVLGLLFVPRRTAASSPGTSGIDWRDSQMWRFGILLGTTASTFFGLNAYMASILAERHLEAHLDIALASFNAAQIAASLAMVVLSRRVLAVPRLLFFTAVLHVAGLAGVLLAGDLGILAALIAISLASSIQLISLTSMPPLIRSPEAAAGLASGMFAIGYVMAFIVPLAAGAIADHTGTMAGALLALLILNLACLPLAWRTSMGYETRLRTSL